MYTVDTYDRREGPGDPRGPLRSIEEEENLDQKGRRGLSTGYMTGGAARRTSRTNRHPREAWS